MTDMATIKKVILKNRGAFTVDTPDDQFMAVWRGMSWIQQEEYLADVQATTTPRKVNKKCQE